MKAEIKKEVFEKFNNNFMAGLLICSELKNKGQIEGIDHLINEIEEYIKNSFNPISLKTHDLITVWEAAAEGFAGKKHYCSPVEEMMKGILKGKGIKKENRVRDLCNFISLKYLVPIDCFDLDLIEGDLEFGIKGKDLVFSQGGYKLSEKLAMKKNKKFDVSDKTKNAVICLEGLPPLTGIKMKKVMDELADLIRTFCKSKVKIYFLDRKNPEVKNNPKVKN